MGVKKARCVYENLSSNASANVKQLKIAGKRAAKPAEAVADFAPSATCVRALALTARPKALASGDRAEPCKSGPTGIYASLDYGPKRKSRIKGTFAKKIEMAITTIDIGESRTSGSITRTVVWPTSYEKYERSMRAFAEKTLLVMKSDSFIHGAESGTRP